MPRKRTVLGRLRALYALIRPMNVLMMGAGVGVGYALAPAQGEMERFSIVLAMLAVLLVGAGGNALNDLFDVEIDRVNRPKRPLPAGGVSPRAARLVTGTCWFLGLAAAAGVSLTHLVVAAGVVLLLWLYSAALKRIPVAGNLAVAVAVAVTPVFGALPRWEEPAVWAAAGFAFLTILAREILKDVEDLAGDALHAVRTLPLVAGAHRARSLAVVLTLATVVLTPVPYLMLGFSNAYLALVFVADILLLWAAWTIGAVEPDQNAARDGSRRLKVAMAAGLAALVFAAPSGWPL